MRHTEAITADYGFQKSMIPALLRCQRIKDNKNQLKMTTVTRISCWKFVFFMIRQLGLLASLNIPLQVEL